MALWTEGVEENERRQESRLRSFPSQVDGADFIRNPGALNPMGLFALETCRNLGTK